MNSRSTHFTLFFRLPFVFIILLTILNVAESSAQDVKYPRNYEVKKVEVLSEFDEKEQRLGMMAEGIPPATIEKLIAERKEIMAGGRELQVTQLQKVNPNPVPYAVCSDMGAENGWGAWSGSAGSNGPPLSWGGITAPPPAAPRFAITSGAGIDPCSPYGGGPAIPFVAPGFGSHSIQLGEQQKPGSKAEQLIYPLTVTAQDTNFVYAHAIVMENPGHSHAYQPWVGICIYDASGNPVPCGCFTYEAAPNLPGFYPTVPSCSNAMSGGAYKPWTILGINLSAYIGQTLTIKITNVDCGYGGHFTHSYWDFSCGVISGTANAFCPGQAVSLCAPVDASVSGYTYQWYQNGQPYTGAPSGTSQCIDPIPNVGDTFVVEVKQPSGCNFHLIYVPQPMAMTPAFTSNVTSSCTNGTAGFTDASTVSNGTPVASWNWSFPGGTPSSSTVQNPSNISYPPGTYTVTLIITSQAGCTDTISQTITINAGATINASTNSTPAVCAPNGTASVNPSGGTTPYSYMWNNGQSSQSISGLLAGNYSVTVTDAGGCSGTATVAVTSNNTFSASTSSTPAICTSSNGSASISPVGGSAPFTYAWSNGQTSPTATGLAAGSYTVTLSDASGCNTTSVVITPSNSIPVLVNPTSTPAICTTANGTASTNPSGGTSPYSFSWNNGQVTQNVSGLSAGNYIIVVTDANGCSGTDTIAVSAVLNPPTANFSSPSICLGAASQFTDNSTGNPATWNWNFGDGSQNLFSQNPTHTYTAPGTYSVTLIVTNPDGCSDTITLPVTLHPLPTAAFTPGAPCLGSITQLTDGSVTNPSSPIVSWNWQMSGGSPSSATSQNTSTIYNTSGAHQVTLIVTTQQGCKDTVSQQVLVYNSPVVNFTGPVKGCAPVCNNYTDMSTSTDGNITGWQWNFPGGSSTSSTIQHPQNICYNTAGNYSASLIVTTSYGCTDTLSMPVVEVYPWPKADFCVAPAIAPATDPVFTFCDLWSSDVVQWTWNFGDNDTDVVSTDPVHSYSATANSNDFYSYNICVRVENQFGCWDTTCKTVELVPEFTFYIPNTFTPNGDFMNEFFYGKSRGVKEYNIWIFDRWGNQIWDCHHEGKNTDWDSPQEEGLSSFCKWDGVVQNGGMDMNGNSKQFAQEDVYIWKVKLTDIFDKEHSYVGHVNIVR